MTPGNVPGLSTFIAVVIGISVIIGFIVLFQSMYTAVLERTREIGILKSLGASKVYIVNLVLREPFCCRSPARLSGVAASYLLKAAIRWRIPHVAD